jgi:hypothetical protein
MDLNSRKLSFVTVLARLIQLGHQNECQGLEGYGSPVAGIEGLMTSIPRTAEQVWDFLVACGEHPLSSASVIKLFLFQDGLNYYVRIGGETELWPTFVREANILLAEAGLQPAF